MTVLGKFFTTKPVFAVLATFATLASQHVILTSHFKILKTIYSCQLCQLFPMSMKTSALDVVTGDKMEVMRSLRSVSLTVCVCVCARVCVSVNMITQKVVDGFGRIFSGRIPAG